MEKEIYVLRPILILQLIINSQKKQITYVYKGYQAICQKYKITTIPDISKKFKYTARM